MMLLTILTTIFNVIVVGTNKQDFLDTYTYDITYIMENYVGRYHEYPSSGEDIINYLKDAVANYSGPDEDVSDERLEYCRKIFVGGKNIYQRNWCMIQSKEIPHSILFLGRMEEWQRHSWDLYLAVNKNGFYDTNGRYLWQFDECGFSMLNDIETHMSSLYPGKLYHKVFRPGHKQPLYFPLGVRVCYNLRDGVSVDTGSAPKYVYKIQDIGDDGTISYKRVRSKKLIEDYVKDMETELKLFLLSWPEINNFDCFMTLRCQ